MSWSYATCPPTIRNARTPSSPGSPARVCTRPAFSRIDVRASTDGPPHVIGMAVAGVFEAVGGTRWSEGEHVVGMALPSSPFGRAYRSRAPRALPGTAGSSQSRCGLRRRRLRRSHGPRRQDCARHPRRWRARFLPGGHETETHGPVSRGSPCRPSGIAGSSSRRSPLSDTTRAVRHFLAEKSPTAHRALAEGGSDANLVIDFT